MKTLPQSLSFATSSRTKDPSSRIKGLLGKLEIKIFRNQKLSKGVETFPSFVMGEPQINIARIKLDGGNPLSDNKSIGESEIIKPRICT